MIRHILLVRTDPAAAAEMSGLFAEVAALRDRLPGILSVAWGESRSPEGMERGYTSGITVDFADRAALASYAADPAHQAIGARIVAAATGGRDGLLVVDLEIDP